jgi:hypothetical protein
VSIYKDQAYLGNIFTEEDEEQKDAIAELYFIYGY